VKIPDLSIVIVSYNVARYLAACLGSLDAGCDGLAVEVFVVDNGSRDRSADLVARQFPGVHLLLNAENLGFAKAVNRALRLARGRYVLLLNPDTVVPPGVLSRLVEVVDRWPEVGLVGPALRHPATGALQSSFRPFPSWRTTFSHYTLAKGFLRLLPSREWHAIVDQPTVDGWLSGACLLIRRNVLDRIGGLDETYFMWCEDIDYCRRAIRVGSRLLYTSETSVFHYEGKSTEQEPPAEVRLQQLQSVLHYLEADAPHRSRVLKPLFKLLFLSTVLWQLAKGIIKITWYRALGDSDKVDKYRRRLNRDAGLLLRLTSRFLRL